AFQCIAYSAHAGPCNYYNDNGTCKYCDYRFRQSAQKDVNAKCYGCSAFCYVPLALTNSTGTVAIADIRSVEVSSSAQLAPIVLVIDDQQLLNLAKQNARVAWMVYVISGRPPFGAGQSPRNGSGSLGQRVTEKAISLRIGGAATDQVEAQLEPLPSGSHEDIEWAFQRDGSGTALTFRSFLKNETGDIISEVHKPFKIEIQQMQGIVFKVLTWHEVD
ncbi:MAG: hypothetical protein KGI52_15875, partial [Burkholderiales bacterium]|nr:hypothetical protein [Burkholderiales bacterium]